MSLMSGTSLRPLMPPAALHQEVNTFAALISCGSLVKPTSVRTPTLIWVAVTPRSVAPEALPPWHTFLRLPKLPPVVCAACEALAVPWSPDELPEPPRLQPAASSVMAASAAKVLIWSLTGFLLTREDSPGNPSVLLSLRGN